MKTRLALIICGLMMLAGCRTTAVDGDVPARITEPTTASRTALQNAVNDALHTDVLLADDALTNSSLLIIERTPPKTMQSPPAMGRIMEPPFRFQLVMHGSDCILVDARDGSRRKLENTRCVAE